MLIHKLNSVISVARRLRSRRATAASIYTCLALVATTACGQPSSDPVVIGKESRTYTSSTRFNTVTFYERGPPGGPRVVADPSRAVPLVIDPRIGRVIALPSLGKYGIVLIQLAVNADQDEFERALDRYNSDPQTGARHRAVSARDRRDGNPIYASGTVDRLLVNEVLVRFRAGTERQAVNNLFESLDGRILRTPAVHAEESYLVQFPGLSGHETRELSNRLDGRTEIVYAVPNFVVVDQRRLPGGGLTSAPASCSTPCAEIVPTVTGGDALFVKQWHLRNAGTSGTSFADINATNAWQITEGETSIVIAVLDDLIETSHQDLAGKTFPAWNALDVDGNGSMEGVTLSQFDMHGTAVAGLAVAVKGNGVGITGIAPQVKILPIRTHEPITTTYAAIERGIRHAANNAHVLSMSWNLGDGDEPIEEIENVLRFATDQMHRVLVFSAGNEQGIEIGYPASRAHVYPLIVVTATNRSDELQTIANSPAACAWGTQVASNTVAAPGVDLYTTDRTGAAGYCVSATNGNYTRFDGTSGAAPLVAGAAALMLSKNPSLLPEAIRDRLQETAEHPNADASPPVRPADASGWGLGWGRIDVCRALQGGEICTRDRQTPSAPTDVVVDP